MGQKGSKTILYCLEMIFYNSRRIFLRVAQYPRGWRKTELGVMESFPDNRFLAILWRKRALSMHFRAKIEWFYMKIDEIM